METSEIVEVLGRTKLFGVLDKTARIALASEMTEHFVPKGQTVLIQDEPGDELYVIARGTVRILRRSTGGDVVELVRRTAPATFGELAVLDGGLRSTTVETATRATLLSLSREAFMTLLYSETAIIQPLFLILADMVRGDAAREADRAFLDLKGRLARRLLELISEAEGDNLTLHNRVTQVQLAQMIGGSRQRVNLALNSLEKSGFIKMNALGIQILNRPGLISEIGD